MYDKETMETLGVEHHFGFNPKWCYANTLVTSKKQEKYIIHKSGHISFYLSNI